MQLLIARETGGPVTKGDIVEVRATGAPLGSAEAAAFCLVEVPDATLAQWQQYQQRWATDIDWAVVGSDPAIDGYRIRLTSTSANVSATSGLITRDAVEQFIAEWNGAVVSVAANDVRFDITIADALRSRAFWDRDLTGVVFTELNYDQATGVHRMQADYSALGANPTAVERQVLHRGCAVVSNTGTVITFEADRSAVRDRFIADIQHRGRRPVAHCQYYVGAGVVDYIVGQGGTITTDAATAASYVRSKLDD